jgi:hypothetical protein
MGAILIKVNNKNKRLIASLAKELGGDVLSINDKQYEDFALGLAMEKEKTGKTVNRKEVFKKLKAK